MSRIFLSYARDDVDAAAGVAQGIAEAGHDVWWDHHLHGGSRFAKEIDRALKDAEAVVVLWSEASVDSAWVQDEAAEGRDSERLVPVAIGSAKPPLGFRQFHTIDLGSWDGHGRPEALDELLEAIGRTCGLADRDAKMASPAVPRNAPAPESICVLPFENISGDPEQSYFSDGITEDIITDLSHVSSLDVTSRNSAFVYKDRRISIPDVARELGVRYVLEGSVRKVGNRVRITAQLIEGLTDKHLWAERYDRDLDDIFAVQDDISRSIVAALKIRLGASESRAIAQRGTSSPEAYRFYLMARRYWMGGWARRRPVIIRLCEKAVQLDPEYARAWALLSICQADLRFSADNSGQYGLEAAERALELDPNLADAYAAKARILAARGSYDEAWKYHERALAIDPGSYEVNVGAARWAIYTHKPEQALKYLTAAAEADATDVWAPGMMLQVYEELGDERRTLAAARESLARVEKALEAEQDNSNALGFGVAALVRLGEMARARDWAELVMLLDPENNNAIYNTACGMAKAGEADIALELLGQVATKIGVEALLWIREDSDWAAFHGDARFEQIVNEAERRLAADGGEPAYVMTGAKALEH
ncbi:MAG: TIR domain-containing protein [Sphingomicrobium sp.]